MPIFNPNQTVPTVKDRIISENTNSYRVLKSGLERSFNLLNQADNIQAMLDDFGTDAVMLFQASAATIQLLQFINPDYVAPTTTNTYTFNGDGTVTLNPPIEE